MTAITQFDPVALQKRVSESVQSQFGMLIPQDAFDAMVAKEVRAYFEDEKEFIVREEAKNEQSYYHGPRVVRTYASMTPFRRQVWTAIDELMGKMLSEKLNSDGLKAHVMQVWNDNDVAVEVELSDRLERMLEKMVPKMAAEMFKGMFAEAVMRAKSEVLSEIRR